jgi:uncharacterized protein YxjI
MPDVTDHNLFLVKEHLGIFKAANNFDVLDPATGQILMECREPKLGFLTSLLRFTDFKRFTPFDVEIREPDGRLVVRVHRGTAVFLSRVKVVDEEDEELGSFQQKFLSIGGKFDVLDRDGQVVCKLVGKWTGWDFRFLHDEQELAHVTKKWSGLGKELFTSADNYVLQIAESVPPGAPVRKLILAAVMCIDMVLKE